MRAKTKNLSQQTHSNMFLLLTWKHNIWMHSKNRWTFTARVPPQTPMILILWASNPTDPARSSQNISNGPSLCHYAMYHKIPYKKTTTSFTMSYHKYTMFDIKKSNSAPISPPLSSTPRALHGWSTMAWMQPGKLVAYATPGVLFHGASWEIPSQVSLVF